MPNHHYRLYFTSFWFSFEEILSILICDLVGYIFQQVCQYYRLKHTWSWLDMVEFEKRASTKQSCEISREYAKLWTRPSAPEGR